MLIHVILPLSVSIIIGISVFLFSGEILYGGISFAACEFLYICCLYTKRIVTD
jgi:hypothetical protein